jgi:hypothetical protein
LKIHSLTVGFEKTVIVNTMEICFEYLRKSYFFQITSSVDGENWKIVADYMENGIFDSPMSVPVNEQCKFIRLSFEKDNNSNPSIWELKF